MKKTIGLSNKIGVLFLIVSLGACGSNHSNSYSGSVPMGELQRGTATFYDANGGGACSFDADGNHYVAAMNQPEFAGSEACGECVEVDGPRGSITVRIVDLCPGCAEGQLDLSREAFAMIGNPNDGRINVTWAVVPCSVGRPIGYKFKEGSNEWWTAIQVRNHRLPIYSLEYDVGHGWVELRRENYNYFVAEHGIFNGAEHSSTFDVRVTAVTGQTLVHTIPFMSGGGFCDGQSQFE